MYTTRDPSNPLSQTQAGVINPDLGQLPKSTVGGGINSSPPSPVNAISFGFVATAILIVMFLAMAFFEHLLRQRIPSLFIVWNSYPNTDVSVLMPGNNCATFIAQPAPLPCRREGIHRSSSYDRSFCNLVFNVA
ncbi:hypothetical protein MKX03_021522 [Papaver bracteatum]|nr:hypothetical protein MKX03_021522 [Papaver bracteatum]